jgi:predicted dehydrogenase
MARNFRVGIIGTGLIVQESHLPACLALPNVQVAALVDSSPGRAEHCARKFGIQPKVLERATDLPGLVDGVLIATPDYSHAEIAVQCLDARLPILVEKPLAPSDGECESIRLASERNSTTVAVGYMFRFWPSVVLVARLLREGTFGRPTRFIMQGGSIGGWSPLSGYYLSGKVKGALSINGSHFLERALHWFGTPVGVRYWDDSRGGPEANATAVLKYDGLEGLIRVSRTARLRPGCAIETTQGVLLHRDWEDPVVQFVPKSMDSDAFRAVDPRYRTDSRPDPYRLQIADFVASCIEGRPPRVTLSEGIAVSRLINALYASREDMPADWYRGQFIQGRVA